LLYSFRSIIVRQIKIIWHFKMPVDNPDTQIVVAVRDVWYVVANGQSHWCIHVPRMSRMFQRFMLETAV